MMARDPKLYLDDILDAIAKIEEYTAGLTKDAFEANGMAVDAVIRNLEIIGEAARNIPEEVKAGASNVPWPQMIGLHNIVVHEYFGVDVDIIWVIVTKNLPETKTLLKGLLDS